MKKSLVFFISIIAILLGCEREGQDSEQLNIKNQGDCTAASAGGLTMEFCLLDLDGTAQRTFQENQNYIFNLILKNHSESTIAIGEDFIDSDFFRVKGITENKDFGVPYTSTWCQFSGTKEILIRARRNVYS